MTVFSNEFKRKAVELHLRRGRGKADDAKLVQAICKLHAQHYPAYGASKMPFA